MGPAVGLLSLCIRYLLHIICKGPETTPDIKHLYPINDSEYCGDITIFSTVLGTTRTKVINARAKLLI